MTLHPWKEFYGWRYVLKNAWKLISIYKNTTIINIVEFLYKFVKLLIMLMGGRNAIINITEAKDEIGFLHIFASFTWFYTCALPLHGNSGVFGLHTLGDYNSSCALLITII